jgi:T5SS/PEP-CTERM-associated repeat protein
MQREFVWKANSISETSMRKIMGHIGKLLACVAVLLPAAWNAACAAPLLQVVPLGVEGGNWAWRVDIDPDEALAGGSTPVFAELGFKLTGAPLLSAEIISPNVFDTPNPGNVVFGWETLTDVDPGPGENLKPVGLQVNTAADEIFAAYGSDFISGATPFLKILTEGPMTSQTTTIQWLGAYSGNGRIAQLTGGGTTSTNFDTFAGTATQTLPSDIRNWINPAGGNFATLGDWNPSETPGATHGAAFNLGGNYTVQFSSDVTNRRLQIGNDDVTFSLDGHGYTLTSNVVSEPSVTVGTAVNEDAHLTLLNGTLSSVDAVIGDGANSSGHVVVGGGATWVNLGNILIARQGSGSLTIQQDGVADVTQDVVLYPGGVLKLQQGGALFTEGVTFQGGGQFDWTGGWLRLTGNSGLTVGAAGFFGPTLLLDPNRTLWVDSTLTIETGAMLVSTNQLKAGMTEVTSDGQLFAHGGLNAGSANVATGGQLFLGGSTQDFGAGLTNHGDTVFTQTTMVDGPVTNAIGGIITAIGDVTFNDLVDGPGGFFGAGTITFEGGMSPGASPASVHIESDVVFGANATLSIELGGTELGMQYDSLQVGGTAMLDGMLAVSLMNDFIPSVGATFDILAAASGISGTFVDLMLPELAANLKWEITYDENSLLLAVVDLLPGDFNVDGVVDAADHVVWRKGVGIAPTSENYNLWRTNFGRTVSDGYASNATVPEPAAALCLVPGAALGCWRRRRLASRDPKLIACDTR